MSSNVIDKVIVVGDITIEKMTIQEIEPITKYIVGANIINNSNNILKSIEIDIEYYDINKKIVGVNNHILELNLAPKGKIEDFKIEDRVSEWHSNFNIIIKNIIANKGGN